MISYFLINRQKYFIDGFIGGYDKNISYLITCHTTKRQIIIDASIHPKHIMKNIIHNPKFLIITHSHSDHVRFIQDYIEYFPDIIVAHHYENNTLFKNSLSLFDGQKIILGNLSAKVIHTPGHHYDSLCIIMDNYIFTGDTIFIGRTGRTIGNKSNKRDLFKSVYKKILTMNEDTIILPGHHYGKVIFLSIKDNIKISPLLRCSNYKEFNIEMNNLENKITRLNR
tara:strand:+ start:19 stop:693 length:675 start_codon:yes stop_codon:yes gene_type:complete